MGHVIHTTDGNCCAHLYGGEVPFASARGVTTWERVMKGMTLFAFACALALASTPGHALSFDFSFSNVTGTVNGTVTGLIEGLTDYTGAGLPALILACGVLLALARRRRRTV